MLEFQEGKEVSLYIQSKAKRKLDLVLYYSDADYVLASFPQKNGKGIITVSDFLIPEQSVSYYRSIVDWGKFNIALKDNLCATTVPIIGFVTTSKNAYLDTYSLRNEIKKLSHEYIIFVYRNYVFDVRYYNDKMGIMNLDMECYIDTSDWLISSDGIKEEIDKNIHKKEYKSSSGAYEYSYDYARTLPSVKKKKYKDSELNIKNPDIFSIVDDKILNLEGFKMILQSSQENLRRYFDKVLTLLYNKDNVKTTIDYIYAKGTLPTMLVAHMDIKHYDEPTEIYHDSEKSVLWSPTGIGGDDRCGLYILFAVLKALGKNNLPSILLTTDEELGCLGAKIAATDIKGSIKDLKYLVELDRRNAKDVVFYETTNPDFHNFAEGFGFIKCEGLGSDIKYLTKEWGIASCNVSVGYYNEHERYEYIKLKEMMETIPKVVQMVLKSVTAPCYKDK